MFYVVIDPKRKEKHGKEIYILIQFSWCASDLQRDKLDWNDNITAFYKKGHSRLYLHFYGGRDGGRKKNDVQFVFSDEERLPHHEGHSDLTAPSVTDSFTQNV